MQCKTALQSKTAMQTAFIAIKLPLPKNPAHIHSTVEAALQTHGTPLRWSITRLEKSDRQTTAHIEAIVTTA
jgi:hypothetical protein